MSLSSAESVCFEYFETIHGAQTKPHIKYSKLYIHT